VSEEVALMGRTMMIRIDGVISDEMAHAFPQMSATTQPAATTLTGEVVDQEELQGMLSLLRSLGFSVVEIVTVPE